MIFLNVNYFAIIIFPAFFNRNYLHAYKDNNCTSITFDEFSQNHQKWLFIENRFQWLNNMFYFPSTEMVLYVYAIWYIYMAMFVVFNYNIQFNLRTKVRPQRIFRIERYVMLRLLLVQHIFATRLWCNCSKWNIFSIVNSKYQSIFGHNETPSEHMHCAFVSKNQHNFK